MNMMKLKRTEAIINSIGAAFVGTFVAVFSVGVMILMLCSMAAEGITAEEVMVLGLLLIFLLCSVKLWSNAVCEFKKARELGRQIAKCGVQKKDTGLECGQSASIGMASLSAAIFGIVWSMSALESGVPIWFSMVGLIFVIGGGVIAVYAFRSAAESKKEIDKAEISEKDARRRRGIVMVGGALTLYDIISGCMAMAGRMSLKVLPMFLLCNAAMILTIIMQMRFRTAHKRTQSVQADEHPTD